MASRGIHSSWIERYSRSKRFESRGAPPPTCQLHPHAVRRRRLPSGTIGEQAESRPASDSLRLKSEHCVIAMESLSSSFRDGLSFDSRSPNSRTRTDGLASRASHSEDCTWNESVSSTKSNEAILAAHKPQEGQAGPGGKVGTATRALQMHRETGVIGPGKGGIYRTERECRGDESGKSAHEQIGASRKEDGG